MGFCGICGAWLSFVGWILRFCAFVVLYVKLVHVTAHPGYAFMFMAALFWGIFSFIPSQYHKSEGTSRVNAMAQQRVHTAQAAGEH